MSKGKRTERDKRKERLNNSTRNMRDQDTRYIMLHWILTGVFVRIVL
jgi:hypothetical protein